MSLCSHFYSSFVFLTVIYLFIVSLCNYLVALSLLYLWTAFIDVSFIICGVFPTLWSASFSYWPVVTSQCLWNISISVTLLYLKPLLLLWIFSISLVIVFFIRVVISVGLSVVCITEVILLPFENLQLLFVVIYRSSAAVTDRHSDTWQQENEERIISHTSWGRVPRTLLRDKPVIVVDILIKSSLPLCRWPATLNDQHGTQSFQRPGTHWQPVIKSAMVAALLMTMMIILRTLFKRKDRPSLPALRIFRNRCSWMQMKEINLS